MNFHKLRLRKGDGLDGFTFVEVVIGIAVLGVGAAVTIGALTKFNSLAAASRNASGAYAMVMNQIDLFQSMSPFNPQKTNQDGTPQIPKDPNTVFPTYDMTVMPANSWRSLSVDGTSFNVPVYQYKDPNTGNVVVVNGQLEIQVTDLATGSPSLPNTYQAVVRIRYTYLGRQYSFSMSAIRTSDI